MRIKARCAILSIDIFNSRQVHIYQANIKKKKKKKKKKKTQRDTTQNDS